jgi:hypothetical protein
VSVPRGGVLRISVEGDGAGRVVSNVVLNRDIVVSNGTLLVAVVNNSSQASRITLIFRFSALQVKVLDGVFEGAESPCGSTPNTTSSASTAWLR